jgi:putative transposase
MARLPRIVVPGVPHHVTQRGNRRQRIFHGDADYALYLDLLAERCRHNEVSVWSYCLMPNHVHLIMTPATAEGLSRAVGEAHRRYTAYINARERVTGHLFQSRFNSVAMDEPHLLAALRYVAMNPVEAQLVAKAVDWPWSSARAHVKGCDDVLVRAAAVRERIPDFAKFLEEEPDPDAKARLLSGQTIGRPLMSDSRLQALERSLGRRLRPLPRGPKPKSGSDERRLDA